ncbi:MAG: DUF2817 domain-containing protein [Verrucomicrobiota bacterium]|nr:DUF2817 domain-containing protein [Verrucomicrobiota bacterium]
MNPLTPTYLKVIEEELLVGVEAAGAADQPWIGAARLNEVLRVCVRCALKDQALFTPILKKVIHPLVKGYSNLLPMTDNDALLWGNLQLSIRLLREEWTPLTTPHRYRSAHALIERFQSLCRQRPELTQVQSIGQVPLGQSTIDILRIKLAAPDGREDEKIQVAVTAGMHGDEAEGIYAIYRWINEIYNRPHLLKFYTFSLYPMLNPYGFEYGARGNANGIDLNREFQDIPKEPEALVMQKEFQNRKLDGLINLHADDDSEGLYGYANGSLLSESLVKPALHAASTIIPINFSLIIDGHKAEGGIIKESVSGALRPLTLHASEGHEPFDVTLETPNLMSLVSRATAHILMLRSLIDEHRKFISQAANL